MKKHKIFLKLMGNQFLEIFLIKLITNYSINIRELKTIYVISSTPNNYPSTSKILKNFN